MFCSVNDWLELLLLMVLPDYHCPSPTKKRQPQKRKKEKKAKKAKKKTKEDILVNNSVNVKICKVFVQHFLLLKTCQMNTGSL